MKQALLTFAFVLGAASASAGIPDMIFPDLTFPPKQPDISTQGCVPSPTVICG